MAVNLTIRMTDEQHELLLTHAPGATVDQKRKWVEGVALSALRREIVAVRRQQQRDDELARAAAEAAAVSAARDAAEAAFEQVWPSS